MAKKYFDFEYLSNKSVGDFKPYGTMGTHSCNILAISEEEIAVKGNNKTVKMFPGWTLGYDCGKVWTIKPASEISNPLHRWARENKISLSKIHRTNDPIRYGTQSKIIGAGWGEIGDSLVWYGGEFYSVNDKYEWIGGIVAYRTQHTRSNGNPSSYRDAIFVRLNVSDEEAARCLSGGFFEQPTNQKLRITPKTWGEFLQYKDQMDSYSVKKILCLACGRDSFDFDFYHKLEMLEALSQIPDREIPFDLEDAPGNPTLVWDGKYKIAS